MIRKFDFDYDFDNDSLFLYDSKSRSKASIEIDDFIVDFNSNKEICAIELLNATKFFKDIDDFDIDKNMLKGLRDCKVDLIPKGNFVVVKLILAFETKTITTPVLIPMLNKKSYALAV